MISTHGRDVSGEQWRLVLMQGLMCTPFRDHLPLFSVTSALGLPSP